MINRNYLNSNVLPIAAPINLSYYGQTNDIPHPSNKIYPTPLTPSAAAAATITLPIGFFTGTVVPPGGIALGLEVGDVILNVDYSSDRYGVFTTITRILNPTQFQVKDAWYLAGDLSAFLLFKPGCRGGAIFELPFGFSNSPIDQITVETVGGITQTIFNGRGPLPQNLLCRKLMFEDSNASTPGDTRTLITKSTGVLGYVLAIYN